MKIINKLGYVLLFFGMLTGCSGLLDDVRPDTYILNSKITVEQLPLLVRGMYKRMLGGLYGQGNFGDEIASDRKCPYGDCHYRNHSDFAGVSIHPEAIGKGHGYRRRKRIKVRGKQ